MNIVRELVGPAGGARNVGTLADTGAKEHGVHFSNGFEDGHAFRAW